MAKKKVQEIKHIDKVIKTVALIFIISLISLSYWFLSLKSPNLPTPPLKTLASSHNIELGVHILTNRLNDTSYVNIVKSQFGFVTIDGVGHWIVLRPTESTYDFSGINTQIYFAQKNNMPVQYHHLTWGEVNFLPKWLINGDYNPKQLMNILSSDINTTVKKYSSEIHVWTVVNEAFTRSQHIYGLRDWWADHTGGGTSYIDSSFIEAHQADPKATLLLNDFDNESINSVSNAEYFYIKSALNRGVPINGIGMQMHINAADPPTKVSVIQNMQRFSALGLKTYITEFDINLNTVKGNAQFKKNLEAQINYEMVRACIESKSCVSFNEFGVSDKESILKYIFDTNSHSYLFDSRYRSKLSFYSFRQALIQP